MAKRNPDTPWTTIRLDKKTVDLLDKHKKPRQTYDDVVKRIAGGTVDPRDFLVGKSDRRKTKRRRRVRRSSFY